MRSLLFLFLMVFSVSASSNAGFSISACDIKEVTEDKVSLWCTGKYFYIVILHPKGEDFQYVVGERKQINSFARNCVIDILKPDGKNEALKDNWDNFMVEVKKAQESDCSHLRGASISFQGASVAIKDGQVVGMSGNAFVMIGR